MVVNRLRDLREDRDLKQKHMAERLGCSQRSISNYESGKTPMPLDLLIEVSHFFDTSIDYILCQTDIKEPYPRNDKK